MPTFSKIAKGVAQFERETFPLLDGTVITLGLRPLLSGIDGDTLKLARAAAEADGVKEPKDGEPLYDYWLGVYTLLSAAVDPDSDPKKPVPFFDGGIDDIRDNLDRERIAYLLQAQRVVQRKCAPRPDGLSKGEFIGWVLKEACATEDDDFFFERWHPWLQKTSVRTLASLYTNLLQRRSLFGSDSPTGAKPSPTIGEVLERTAISPELQESIRLELIALERAEAEKLKAVLDAVTPGSPLPDASAEETPPVEPEEEGPPS